MKFHMQVWTSVASWNVIKVQLQIQNKDGGSRHIGVPEIILTKATIDAFELDGNKQQILQTKSLTVYIQL